MTDFTGILLSAFLSALGALVTIHFYMNYAKSKIFDEAFEWFSVKMNDENAAKVIWKAGYLLGNGLKQGTGIGSMMGKGGKLNLTDLIIAGVQRFIFPQTGEEKGEEKKPLGEDKRTGFLPS